MKRKKQNRNHTFSNFSKAFIASLLTFRIATCTTTLCELPKPTIAKSHFQQNAGWDFWRSIINKTSRVLISLFYCILSLSNGTWNKPCHPQKAWIPTSKAPASSKPRKCNYKLHFKVRCDSESSNIQLDKTCRKLSVVDRFTNLSSVSSELWNIESDHVAIIIRSQTNIRLADGFLNCR